MRFSMGIKRLGDVCEIKNGGTPKTSIKEYWNGEVLWITPKDLGKLESKYVDDTPRKISKLGLQRSSAKLIVPNSVILSTRAPIGHLAINLRDISTNQGCRGIEPKDGLDTHYLYYFLLKSVDLLNQLGTGATFAELSTKSLASVEIPLPSLEHQKQIVFILDNAFAAIDQAKANVERNLENARELFQSKLNEVFEQRGEGWEEYKIGDVLIVERGGSPRPIKEYITTSPDGLNWIKISDASNSSKYIFKTKEKIKKEGLHKTRFVKEGDFLLSNSMSFGRPYILKTNGCIHDGWLVLRDKNEVDINKDYLYYNLCSPALFKQFDNLAAGSTVRNLNIELVSSVKIHIPPINVQINVSNELELMSINVERIKKLYVERLKNLEEMKKSILQKAFNGEFNIKTAFPA